MFNSLRDKLSGWFKGKEEKAVEKPKKEIKKKEIKKPGKKKAEKSAHPPAPKNVEIKLKKKAEKIKEEVPVKFDAGKQKFEPDIDKILEGREEEKTEIKEEKIIDEEDAHPPAPSDVKTEKKGFFERIKKTFVSEEKKPKPLSSESRAMLGLDLPSHKGDAEKPELKSEKEVEERAEELEEEIEEELEEKAREKEEVLDKEEVEEEITEKKGFFGRLANRLTNSELKGEEFSEMFEELEFSLLENNVALSVVDKIKENLGKELIGKKFGKKEVEEKILEALKKSIDSVLVEGEDFIERIKKKDPKEPFVILFFGINGSGKTTSIAKLAWKLKKAGIESVLAAADTFRAASIEQLETHAKKIGVDIVKDDYGKDPASVAFEAIAYAKKHHKRVVLIDTAGRMYTKSNLMKEMEKVVKVSKPDLKIFVGESITGNDATEQAKMFNETAGIDGIILSKADVDEKAGSILSVSFVTGKPILFLGVGQEYEDLQEFKKKNVLKGLGLE